MIGTVKNMVLFKKDKKIDAKKFSWEDLSLKNMKTIEEIKCIEWDPTKQIF